MLGLPLGFAYFEAATKAEHSHLLRELSDDDLHGGGVDGFGPEVITLSNLEHVT